MFAWSISRLIVRYASLVYTLPAHVTSMYHTLYVSFSYLFVDTPFFVLLL